MRTCAGYGERAGTCTAALAERNTTGLCTKCYANKNYRDNHPKAAGKKRTGEPKKAYKFTAPSLMTNPSQEVAVAEPRTALEVPASEPCVTLHIPISRMNRLLLALL